MAVEGYTAMLAPQAAWRSWLPCQINLSELAEQPSDAEPYRVEGAIVGLWL